jgi:hypothetical protein
MTHMCIKISGCSIDKRDIWDVTHIVPARRVDVDANGSPCPRGYRSKCLTFIDANLDIDPGLKRFGEVAN